MRVDWTHGRVALAVFFAALFAYLSNGTLFPLDADTAPNVYLPASVLGDGDLAFSPFEAPFMFAWTAKAGDGKDVSISNSFLWTVSVKRIDARTTERSGKVNGAVVETSKRTVSPDGQTLTIVTTGNNDGNEYSSTQVFTREKAGTK